MSELGSRRLRFEVQSGSVDAMGHAPCDEDVVTQMAAAAAAMHLCHGEFRRDHLAVFLYGAINAQKHRIPHSVVEEDPAFIEVHLPVRLIAAKTAALKVVVPVISTSKRHKRATQARCACQTASGLKKIRTF